MSELDETSVVEPTEPVMSGGEEPSEVIGATDTTVAALPADDAPVTAAEDSPVIDAGNAPPPMERATNGNFTVPKNAMDNFNQDEFRENTGQRDASEGTPVTVAGRMAKEAEQEEHRIDAHERAEKHLDELAEREERRKEWLSRTHDVGGLMMSGTDLEKLMDFAKTPEAKKAIAAALKTKMAPDKITKAQKEMDEFIKLKEKERDEGLTKDEQRRLKEINQSPEFRVYSEAAIEFQRDRGVVFADNSKEETLKSQVAVGAMGKDKARQDMFASRATPVENKPDPNKLDEFDEISKANFGQSHFVGAPPINADFTSSASPVPQTAKSAPASDADFDAVATTVAAQVREPQNTAIANRSFG